MAGRSQNRNLLLAKIQPTPGVNASPAAGSDAVLLYGNNPKFDYQHLTATREVNAGYFRGAERLVWGRRADIQFQVELQGSGTAGTAPAWGKMLKGCAFAETLTAGLVEYTLVTDGAQQLSMLTQEDGLFKPCTDMMGDCSGELVVGSIPVIDYKFRGLVLPPTSGSNLTGDTTVFIPPRAVSPADTAALRIGATYAAGAFTSGDLYNFRSLKWSLGNDIQIPDLASSEQTGFYGRNPKIEFTIDCTSAQEKAFLDDAYAGTRRSLGALHGTVAGKICGLFAPAFSITDVKPAYEGSIRYVQISADLTPTSANNEFRIFLK
jgi:hypothetical protein